MRTWGHCAVHHDACNAKGNTLLQITKYTFYTQWRVRQITRGLKIFG